jgi:NAD(P) transhydrogenase subunit alpha
MQQKSDSVRLGVPRETGSDERRVALVPHTAGVLGQRGFTVCIESQAGASAGFRDEDYTGVGAEVVADRASLLASCELVLQIRAGSDRPEEPADASLRDKVVVALCDPLSQPEAMAALASQHTTCFALELVPRITRAQSMDVLSSMATVAGYKAVLLAAEKLDKMFPMLMTAAGTVTPARVLVIGAGVAGLQAIATARRLGAVVSAYASRWKVWEPNS